MIAIMKAISILAVTVVMLTSQQVRSEEDVAHQRAVYEDINKAQPKLKKVTATRKDDELTFEMEGWLDGKSLRKIVEKVPGEDGDGWEEFYLENEVLVFAFRSYIQGSGKTKKQVEDRFYFKDGKMVKWIGEDKKLVPADRDDFKSEATRLLSNAKLCVAALKGKSKEAPEAAAVVKTTEGTFLRIDEGDYFHWIMKTKDEVEKSYFIIKTDAAVDKVVAEPEKFVGQKCKIQWKESNEVIPEAGGKIKIEQILSVEWIGKK